MNKNLIKNEYFKIIINRSINHLIKYILFSNDSNKEDSFETSILGSYKVNLFKINKRFFNTLSISINKNDDDINIDIDEDNYLKVIKLTFFDFLYIENNKELFFKFYENEDIINLYNKDETYLYFLNIVNKSIKYFFLLKDKIDASYLHENKDFNNSIYLYKYKDNNETFSFLPLDFFKNRLTK